MTQSPQDPSWLAWIPVVGGVIGGLYTGLKALFVTHGQLRRALETMEKRREEREDVKHAQNLENFQTVFERMAKVEQSQARTEGMLSGRYPRIER
jgi:hypothetical protein